MTNWEEIRGNYPLVSNNCYLNTASFGAVSKNTHHAQQKYLESNHLHGTRDYYHWIEDYNELKDRLSGYLNTNSKNLALIPDASNGTNKIAELLPKDHTVIMVEEDFPSIVLPWITRNYLIDWIGKEAFLNDPISQIETKLKKGNRILALSWVHYNSGLKIDLKKVSELCEEYATYLVVDATQGLGAFSLDLSEVKIDFLVASCFKWFMSGYGICIGYFSDRIFDEYDLPFSGWNSLKDFDDNLLDMENYKKRAARMEVGHLKYQNMIALNTSFMEMEEIGLEQITSRTQELVHHLRRELEHIGLNIITPESSDASGILCIEPQTTIVEKLKSSNIMCTIRKNYIRFGLYFYNNENDIDHLIDVIKN